MILKVLKEWGDFKEGDVIDTSKDNFEATQVEVDLLIEQGVFEISESTDDSVQSENAGADVSPENTSVGDSADDSTDDTDDSSDDSTVEKTDDTDDSADEEISSEDTGSEKTYMGKKIISENNRELNDKTYIEIRLEDGSTHDLTSDQYEAEVKLMNQ